jgi:hypothetical protein
MAKQKEIKTCNLCKLGINPEQEFAKFIHYKKADSILSEAYYHIICYRERMLGAKQSMESLARANAIMNAAAQKLGVMNG